MGIPNYFKYIITKHTNIITTTPHVFAQKRCDRLFLDFNSVIHQSAMTRLANHVGTSVDEFDELVIKDCMEFIRGIINKMRPLELCFIAIDGVCPFAKMMQQRNRRYLSVWRINKLQELIKNNNNQSTFETSVWNSNCVTPGTTFMTKMNNALKQYTESGAFPCKVILSDSNDPGEGEHKIFNYIRANNCQQQQKVDFVYGLDADLILLSLLSKNQQTYLLRENNHFSKLTHFKDHFLLLDIYLLGESIFTEFKHMLPQTQITKNQAIKDYVMLMSFMGNDFIPPLSYMKIKDNGLHTILNKYFKTVQELNQFLVHDNKLNELFITKLIQSLSHLENEYMNNVVTQYQQLKPPSTSLQPGVRVDHYPLWRQRIYKIDPSTKGWRQTYYYELFASKDDTIVKESCAKYFKTLQWIFAYYFMGSANPTWCYPYTYSPCIQDLGNYLLSSDCLTWDEPSETTDIKLNPALQLLIVIPPQNIHLIEKKFHKIMQDIKYGCTHMFPINFRLHTFLKMFLWECHAELPPIDLVQLHTAYVQLQ